MGADEEDTHDSLATARTKSFVAALAFVERLDLHELDLLHGLHHELRDSLTTFDGERLGRVMVDEADFQLAAVARVDEPRGIEAGHAVLDRETAPGLHEAGVAVGERNRDTGGYQRSASGRRKDDIFSRDEIHTGVARSGVGREGQVGIETEDRKIEHEGNVAEPEPAVRCRLP